MVARSRSGKRTLSYAKANCGESMNNPVPQGPNHSKVVRAGTLMREALLLLDEAGASLAGCQLQHAIDTLDLMPSVTTQE